MHLIDARYLAMELFEKHSLQDWRLEWDRSKRRFGSCSTHKKQITLSKHLVLCNGIDEVRETILHEIAHAIAPPERKSHGPLWKACAARIGAMPKACYGSEVTRPPYKYQQVCLTCGYRRRRFAYRARQSSIACSSCCKQFNNGLWDKRFLFHWEEI
jgi:predicted SprT family Zn-dependent metalloprotease